ncbi:ATP-binding cassette domain-containing protein [Pontibacter sp. G13]|uniref:ATP-binding cassette domain-containing protein n=1 Tax=Pontibacter sp. G13 TaxID=3074898 RepID=UPI00288AE10F|nr:ATP-binding cassette domain-containing protein [Pontibacter sp. G13]WNJ19224.1 ATP-binding cassette domain-containing protein [Pontibacter sp. G13]
MFQFPDIQCPSGESLLILGQSGKGKTTLLHLLAGLLRPSAGEILIGQQNLSSLSLKRLDAFRGKNIGIVFQRAHFVQGMTVAGNLKLAQYLAGLPTDMGRIEEVLDRLGILSKLHQPTQRLSLGEQQRVAIARAVLNRPEVLLADEPTSSLDDYHTEEVVKLLEEQAQDAGASLVIVTHDNRLKSRFSRSVLLS